MNYLGLDFGTKTLGLAISKGLIATTLKTINYTDEEVLIDEVNKIINKNDISVVILGLPKNMNNTIGERAKATLVFKKQLEDKLAIKVIMQDERLSTKSAEATLIEADLSREKRKKIIDSVAATIILQNYLDKINKEERYE